jgi:hypothetical protein
MNKRNISIAAVLILLLIGASWAFGLFGGTDPAVAELQQMRDQMFDRNLPDDQRQQFRDQFRERMGSLSDAQRRALFDSGREVWQKREQQRMNEFFAMSPVDQRKRLDQTIDDMLKRQKERAQNANANNGQANGGNGGGRGNRGNMTDAQREQRAKQRLDRSTPIQRAQREEYRRMLESRARDRGIDPNSLGRGWPGGGRGRT